MRYLINITYKGTNFNGSQVQKDKSGVYDEIEKMLTFFLRKDIKVVPGSRTDAKVHAINSYAHFDYDNEIDEYKIRYKINKRINKDIYVKSIKKVKDDFHARFDCIHKSYVYKINMGTYFPVEADIVFQYNKIIEEDIIKEFINKMSGEHNFESFSYKKYNSYIKNIKIDYKIESDYLYLYFSSKSFMQYMIRNIIGYLININEGKVMKEDIDKIFSEKESPYVMTASPNGLYLIDLEYEGEIYER